MKAKTAFTILRPRHSSPSRTAGYAGGGGAGGPGGEMFFQCYMRGPARTHRISSK